MNRIHSRPDDIEQVDRRLREAEALYWQLVEHQPNLICRFLPDTTLTFVNRAYAEFFGTTPEALLGKHFIKFLQAEEQATVLTHLARCSPGTPSQQYRHRARSADGRECWHEWTDTAIFDGAGRLVCFQSVATEVTERVATEDALFREKERAQVTLHSIGDAVITTDAAGRVDYLNPAAEALTEWAAAEALGHPVEEIYHLREDPVEEPRAEAGAPAVGAVLIGRSGRESHVEQTVAPISGPEGEPLGTVVVFRDVSESRRLARQMAHDARHDALTGLVNRREFERRVERALADAREQGRQHALCYLDLDRFKIINDTAGHVAGDEFLRQIGAVVDGAFRARDTFARLGGDEFGLLLDDCPLPVARKIAETVVGRISEHRFHWHERVFVAGVSVGMVPVTEDSESKSQLLSHADSACYTAKKLGGNRIRVHRADDRAPAHHQGEVLGVATLREALDRGRFCMHFQPIFRLGGGAPGPVVRYEALLRMLGDEGGLIMPGAFVPAAERYGLMGAIDAWVVQTVLGQPARVLRERRGAVSINLSASAVDDGGLLEFLGAAVRRSALLPEDICFEITETAAVHNVARARQFILDLKGLGVRVALDDFGSGMSSFRHLKALPVDYLKIDGCFVREMLEDTGDGAVVAAINDAAHALGVETIAEFAHSEAIVERLGALGVDYAQGYALGRPGPLV